MFAPDTQFLTQKGPIKGSSLTGREKLLGYTGAARPSALSITGITFKSHSAQLIQIQTERGLRLTVTPDHQLFAQLKGPAQLYDVFLVKKEGLGFVVALGSGQLRDLAESTMMYEKQAAGKATEVEKFWLVATFRTLAQATYVEQLLSIRYGLPVFALDPRLRKQGLSEDLVEKLLKEVDTSTRASRLLKDADLSEAMPHFQRKLLSVADQARQHYLDGVFYEPVDAQRGAAAGVHHVLRILNLGDGVKFSRDRIRYLGPARPLTESFSRPDDLERRLGAHARDAYTDIHRRIMLPLPRPYFFWPASYLREGMVVPVHDGIGFSEDPIVQISRSDPSGDVLQIELEGQSQIVAGGVLVGTFPQAQGLPL